MAQAIQPSSRMRVTNAAVDGLKPPGRGKIRPKACLFFAMLQTGVIGDRETVSQYPGSAVLVRTDANKSGKPVPGQLNELARQNASWSEVKCRQGSEIFGEAEPADYVYLIREGAVQTYKQLSDGRRQIGAFLLRGDIFGAEDGEVHRFTAEAIVDTTLWIAKRRRFFARPAKGDISAANNMRDLVTRNLEHVEYHVLLLGCQKSLEKVAAFLLEIDRRLGCPEVMVLPMKRRDIADYLGMTLETVSRALSVLRDEGILSVRGRKIVLNDRSKLAQRATSA
jgi:CRP/FNR family nitrogen fixation transcriptional regulator